MHPQDSQAIVNGETALKGLICLDSLTPENSVELIERHPDYVKEAYLLALKHQPEGRHLIFNTHLRACRVLSRDEGCWQAPSALLLCLAPAC